MNNGIVEVLIEKDEVVVSSKNYSNILVLGEFDSSRTTPAFNERVRMYTSLETMKREDWSSTDPVYRAVASVFAQSRRPEYVFVGKKKASPDVQGKDPESLEEALSAIIDENDNWYGIVSTLKTEKAIATIADFVEVQKKIFAVSLNNPDFLDLNSTKDIANVFKAKGYKQTTILWHESATTANDAFLESAWLAQGFSFELGSVNWSTLPITGITPSPISREKQITLDAKNVNYYIPIYNLPRVRLGRVIGGEWIDIVTGVYHLQSKLDEAVTDALIRPYSKLGYVDSDIQVIRSAIETTLLCFKSIRFIDKYIIIMPKACDISAQEKKKRELNNIEFEALLVGAFNTVKIRGVLTDRGTFTLCEEEEVL